MLLGSLSRQQWLTRITGSRLNDDQSYSSFKSSRVGYDPCTDPAACDRYFAALFPLTNRRTTMLVNLTPHAITLQSADGTRLTVPPSGTVARIATRSGDCEYIQAQHETDTAWGGIPIYQPTAYLEPKGLPDYDPAGTDTYIVSALFADRVGDRHDVVYPGTGPNDGCIRDGKGQVVAVTRLIRA